MKNVESSMDWMSFSNKMKQVACQLSSSACPMVLVLPDGREIRFTDIEVGMFNYKGKRGDTEYTSIGFKVNLLGAEVTDGKDDGSLANSPYGNGAKMREAVKHMIDTADSIAMRNPTGIIGKLAFHIKQTGDAALAEPPRNCDVGTVEEQAKRMDKFCYSHRHGFDGRSRYACENCKFFSVDRCELAWAQMPYKGENEK